MNRPNEPLEITEALALFPLLEDGSCQLQITATDRWQGQQHRFRPLVLPYPLARALHEHLSQYLVRQQVYDAEFRPAPPQN